ncbi:hypothetical protein BDW72DRAFT_44976 [Aspergillus terricola var. indicus]
MPPKKIPEKAQATGPAAGTRARSRSPEKITNTGNESSLSTNTKSLNTLVISRCPSQASIASNATSNAASNQSVPGYFPESSPPERPAINLNLAVTPALLKPINTLTSAISQAPKYLGAAQKHSYLKNFNKPEPPITVVRRSTGTTSRSGATPTPVTQIPTAEDELSNAIKHEHERGDWYKEQLLSMQKLAKKHLAELQANHDQEVQDFQEELARLKATQLENYQEHQENAPHDNGQEGQIPTITRPRPQDTLVPENPFLQPHLSRGSDNLQHWRANTKYYQNLADCY